MAPRLPRRRDEPERAPAPAPPPRPVGVPPALGDLLRAGPVAPGLPTAPDDVVLVLPEPAGRRAREVAVPLARALGARLVADEADADGAGTAVAVGWRAVATVLRAQEVGARALLVADHEPDLLPVASSEHAWAQDALRRELPTLATGAWLAETVRERYGAVVTAFTPGIAHDVFAPLPVLRREDLVVLVARPRQALPLAVLALADLRRRRPELEIAVVGERAPLDLPFAHTHAGALGAAERAEVFNTATVALVPSLSVPPAVAGELLACACPVVLPDAPAARDLGPAPLLADPTPAGLAAALERLVDDPEDRSDRARAGLAAAQAATWDGAAATVRAALAAA